MKSGPIRWKGRAAVLLLLTCALGAAFASVAECAASPAEVVAGWEGDGFDQGYGFATLGKALGRGKTSYPIRLDGNYLYYNYVDQGEEVRVSGPGAAVLFGARMTKPRAVLAALTGAEIRWEKREHGESGVPAGVVARGGAIAQVEGDFVWSRRVHPFLFANYAGASQYLYGRGGIRWQANNLAWSGPLTWSFGVEGVAQGNADTDAVQAGGLVECTVARSRLSFSLRFGYKDSASGEERRQSGYLGATVWHQF
jgi:hypothetical protein